MINKEIALFILGLLGSLFGLAMSLLVFALPFLFVYAIYRVIKGIMTHNAELKSRYGNRNGEDH